MKLLAVMLIMFVLFVFFRWAVGGYSKNPPKGD